MLALLTLLLAPLVGRCTMRTCLCEGADEVICGASMKTVNLPPECSRAVVLHWRSRHSCPMRIPRSITFIHCTIRCPGVVCLEPIEPTCECLACVKTTAVSAKKPDVAAFVVLVGGDEGVVLVERRGII